MKFVALFGLGLTLSVGCVPKKTVKDSDTEAAEGVKDASGKGIDDTVEELDPRGKDFASIPELETIRFEYDRYALSPDMRIVLANNAEVLKKQPSWEVLVEGHCDSRGTIQYNLALGEKRALEVRNYYRQLGVPSQRVATLTYGESRPLCEDDSADCMSQNRRAVTKVHVKKEPIPEKE